MSGKTPTLPRDLRRFKRYPEYKDSGIEWLAEVPVHWCATKMWAISRAMSGATPPKDDLRYWNGGIPWVSAKDMKRRFLDSSEDTVSIAAIKETGLKLIEPPVVLIVVRGMILAHTFPVAIAQVPLTINQDMKALQLCSGVDHRFLAYWLEGVGHALLGLLVEEAAHGTKAIRMDQWRNAPVQLPPESEQSQIVRLLDNETAKIDVLIARKRRLLELLEEKRTALIARAVTKGLDTGAPLTESGLEWVGRVPAHWTVKRISDIAESLQTGPFGSQLHAGEYVVGGRPVINPANLQAGRIISDPRCAVSAETASRLERHKIRLGDILFARRGELGRCALVTQREDGWLCGTGCLRFRPRATEVDPRFVAEFLSTRGVAEWLQLQSVGSTMQNLNTTIVGRLPVVVPPLPEQAEILGQLDGLTSRISSLLAMVGTAIDKLDELRTALVFAAVTGKIDVREEVA